MLYPEMFGELLAFHDKLTVCVGAAVPVPVADPVVVEGWALLVNVRIALSAPVICGLKVTVNDMLCPAGMSTGSAKLPTVNRELFVLAAVTVTFAPLALRLAEVVWLVPTVTLPKSSLLLPRSKLPDC